MWKYRFSALLLILLAALAGFFVYKTEQPVNIPGATATSTPIVSESRFAFKLGLDLNGGTHLVYKADTSQLKGADISGAMSSLREVIERRVNLFGVSEPIVQTEQGGVLGGGENRLIVELPGVSDIEEAIKLIGLTPLLEFRLAKDEKDLPEGGVANAKSLDDIFIQTELTGRFLEGAQVDFDQTTGEPKVLLTFNKEGEALFAKITKENVDKVLAIFLDGAPISTPVIREEITGGTAVISGNFRADEARQLVRDLNYGALPVPISLVSTQTIGATLGEAAAEAGVRAGLFALLFIAAFLVIWYRLPGAVAVVALCLYVVVNLALFKLIPVTLTAAGIAGLILSMGMAVDANILIFERMKEELRKGRVLSDAMKEGFARAWTSIRDSNISSIITAIILYYFAATPVIQGFALVFFIGVITSMFTAITASRTMLYAVQLKDSRFAKFVFGSGVHS